MLFPDRLISAMEQHCVTQRALAAAIGCEPQQIYKYVSGQRAPALTQISLILKALPNVDARWLICGGEHVR